MAGYHIQVGFVVTYGITTYQDRCCSQLWYDDISRCNAHFECVCFTTSFLVEQELLSLPEHLSSPRFSVGSCYSIFSFMCMFCGSLFAVLYFFFWPLCCPSFFDVQILITPLVSSNSSRHFLNSIFSSFLNIHIKLKIE
jgi:hypothetical protein